MNVILYYPDKLVPDACFISVGGITFWYPAAWASWAIPFICLAEEGVISPDLVWSFVLLDTADIDAVLLAPGDAV